MSASQQIIEAVRQGDVARVNQLLASDPALADARNENGVSAVLLATYYGRNEIAQVFLAKGARLDIFEASAVGQAARVEAILVEKPELVNAYADDGFTPLGLASFFCHTDVVRLLINRWADVNAASRNTQRVAPLHSAVSRRQTLIAEELLRAGAQVNARQQEGVTPLHQAAHNGQAEMVKLLLQYGADPNARTDGGRTTLSMAIETGNSEVVDLLRARGAKR